MAKTGEEYHPPPGEDGGGWYRTQTWHHSWTREEGDGQDRRRWQEDGTEPRPGIIAGQGRKETAKTGEDGGGWYRTQTWHHSWTREEGDGQDRRRWRRMVQNQTWHHSWTREEGDGQDRRRWRRMVQNPDLAS